MQISSPLLANQTNVNELPVKTVTTQNNASQLPDPVSNYLFLNNIRPEQAREFLLNHLNRKLDVSPSNINKNIVNYSKDTNTVNSTTNQIIQRINNALAGQSSNMNESVINNINNGFSEAKDVLQNLNILRREILIEFNDIQQNVNTFLENIKTPSEVDSI